MFRFLHSSDLHLGKPFGRHTEDVRGRLRQARHDVLARLATAARDAGAHHVMLAGDTFDQETPAPAITRQALNAMAQADDITWVLMPGNHDSLAATELWQTIARDKPDNVVLVLDAAPLDLGGGYLLPAPCTTRNPGRDLTHDMAAATPQGAIRIGLGHGGIQDFKSLGSVAADGPSGTIAPDRATLAGLDYLGLGDWHGQLKVSSNTWYSGTPEADSFKHTGIGSALAVSIAAAGATPTVTPVQTGTLHWFRLPLDITPEEDCEALISLTLPPLGQRRDTLLQVTGEGRVGVRQMRAITGALSRVTPDFLSVADDLTALRLAHDGADLEAIDPSSGALRQAAEALSAQGQDGDLSAEERRTAATALSQLFSFVAEDTP